MADLKAVMINCTLKYAPEVSNTEALMLKVKAWWDRMDVETEMVRVTDYHVRFGVSSDEGNGDEWPVILEKILAADIICHGDAVCECRRPGPVFAASFRPLRPPCHHLLANGGQRAGCPDCPSERPIPSETRAKVQSASVFSKHQGIRRQGADGVQDPW